MALWLLLSWQQVPRLKTGAFTGLWGKRVTEPGLRHRKVGGGAPGRKCKG